MTESRIFCIKNQFADSDFLALEVHETTLCQHILTIKDSDQISLSGLCWERQPQLSEIPSGASGQLLVGGQYVDFPCPTKSRFVARPAKKRHIPSR